MSGARDLGRPVETLARCLRVPAFAGCAVALAVLAHVAGGGPVPGWDQVLLLSAVVALLWGAASRSEATLPRLLLGVTGTQLGLHVALLDHAGHRPTGPALLAHLAAAALLAVALRRHELTCRPRRMAVLLTLTDGVPRLRIAPLRSQALGPRDALPPRVHTARTPPHRGPPLPERLAA